MEYYHVFFLRSLIISVFFISIYHCKSKRFGENNIYEANKIFNGEQKGRVVVAYFTKEDKFRTLQERNIIDFDLPSDLKDEEVFFYQIKDNNLTAKVNDSMDHINFDISSQETL